MTVSHTAARGTQAGVADLGFARLDIDRARRTARIARAIASARGGQEAP